MTSHDQSTGAFHLDELPERLRLFVEVTHRYREGRDRLAALAAAHARARIDFEEADKRRMAAEAEMTTAERTLSTLRGDLVVIAGMNDEEAREAWRTYTRSRVLDGGNATGT